MADGGSRLCCDRRGHDGMEFGSTALGLGLPGYVFRLIWPDQEMSGRDDDDQHHAGDFADNATGTCL